jgi:uncharacterized protein (DUF2235 family)
VEDADAAFTVAPRRIVHVVVMDGTLSSLEEGFETNVGLAYRLLKRNAGPGVTLHYQPGLQFDRGDLLASAWSVLTGSGLICKFSRSTAHWRAAINRAMRFF